MEILQEIEQAREEALDQGRDAVVYDQLSKEWRAGMMSEIPERSRNGEVSYYHHSILFSPTLEAARMGTVVQGREHLVPIAPEDCLFMQVHCAGDYLRLSRLFAVVWQRVPQSAKHLLKLYWERDFIHNVGGPDIKYVDWPSMVKGRTTAWVYRSGHEMVFRGFIVDRMPDGVVQSLVVHQLAAAYAFANARADGEVTPSIYECDVEQVLEDWGVEPHVFFVWEQDHKRQIRKWEKEADRMDTATIP